MPYIVIYTYTPDSEILKEIKAGIEEESGLYIAQEVVEDVDSLTLSYQSSKQSSLGIGIGINKKSIHMSVQQQLKPVSISMVDETPRNIGQNAVRFIKGKPLR